MVDEYFKPLTIVMLLVASCAQKPQFTAEEAGWQGEVKPFVDATCAVGTSVQVQVGSATRLCGYGENCTFKTVPLYATHRVQAMPAPVEDSEKYWKEARDHIAALLPPDGLIAVHSALRDALDAQVGLNDTTSQLTGDQRSALLETRAAAACKAYNSFQESVMNRPVPAELEAPSFSVSFQPAGTPTSFGVNSSGEFSVTVSNSIPTPFGNVTFSSSKATASPEKPKRLVIRSGGRERVLLMDRDFEIWIPSTHGVRVANTEADFIIDVDSRLPIHKPRHSRAKPAAGSV